MSESGDLRESHAFKEYNVGRSAKIKAPWATIIIIGILAAIISFVLYFYGIVVLGNAYAMNMIIGLIGLPAGFVIAFKNKTSDILVSWRYSSYTALVYTAAYFVIGTIMTSISSFGLAGLFGGLFSLFLSCLMIAAYSVLFTFALGALFGTMINGYIDDKRK